MEYRNAPVEKFLLAEFLPLHKKMYRKEISDNAQKASVFIHIKWIKNKYIYHIVERYSMTKYTG